jgi:hypothetical protein
MYGKSLEEAHFLPVKQCPFLTFGRGISYFNTYDIAIKKGELR